MEGSGSMVVVLGSNKGDSPIDSSLTLGGCELIVPLGLFDCEV